MAVLKTTSPVVVPSTPTEMPSKTVPSSSARTAGFVTAQSSNMPARPPPRRFSGVQKWPEVGADPPLAICSQGLRPAVYASGVPGAIGPLRGRREPLRTCRDPERKQPGTLRVQARRTCCTGPASFPRPSRQPPRRPARIRSGPGPGGRFRPARPARQRSTGAHPRYRRRA